MALSFHHVCELFEQVLAPPRKGEDAINATVQSWFQRHNDIIVRQGPRVLALLSCLLPQRRADRVYGLQEHRLRTIIKNAQGLGKSRIKELQRLQDVQGLDFASAVQFVFSATEPAPSASHRVTVEEIEHSLNHVASASEFSSPMIQGQFLDQQVDHATQLTRLFRRVDSIEAKWLVRLILKDLRPTMIPETTVLRNFHFLLPDWLMARNSLAHALQLAEGFSADGVSPYSPLETDRTPRTSTSAKIEPQLGVMIGLPSFEKARSINHCCQEPRLPKVISVASQPPAESARRCSGITMTLISQQEKTYIQEHSEQLSCNLSASSPERLLHNLKASRPPFTGHLSYPRRPRSKILTRLGAIFSNHFSSN